MDVKHNAIKQVEKKGMDLEQLAFKGDKDVVLVAVKQNGMALQFASDEMKVDRDVVLTAVKQNGKSIRYTSLRDLPIVMEAIQSNGSSLAELPYELKRDRAVVLAAVKQNGIALQFAAHNLLKDRLLVLEAIQSNGESIKYAPAFKADKELILIAVKQYGLALQYASPELKSDSEVVLAAVKQNSYALQYASPELKANREVVLAAVTKYGIALDYASPALKEDKELISIAVKQNAALIKIVPPIKNLVLDAIQHNAEVYDFIVPELKDDLDIIQAVYAIDPNILDKLPDIIWMNIPFLKWVAKVPLVDIPVMHRSEVIAYKTTDPPEQAPQFRRQITEGNSNQGRDTTCSFHANSKIILHNMFLFLVPKTTDRTLYDKNNCNAFLNTDTITTDPTLLDNLSEDCSSDGYDKILLFLYLYFLYRQETECGCEIYTINKQIEDRVIPAMLEGKHLPRLHALLDEIHVKRQRFNWVDFKCDITTNPFLLFDIIRKITNLKFYVKLNVHVTIIEKGKPTQSGHALTIIGTSGEFYIIKNSWGYQPDIIHMDLSNFKLPFQAGDAIGYAVHFYIPIPKENDILNRFINKDNTITNALKLFNRSMDAYGELIRSVVGGSRKRTKRVKRNKFRTRRLF